MKKTTSILLPLAAFFICVNNPSLAAEENNAPANADTIIKSALDFLKSQQRPDGTWQRSRASPSPSPPSSSALSQPTTPPAPRQNSSPRATKPSSPASRMTAASTRTCSPTTTPPSPSAPRRRQRSGLQVRHRQGRRVPQSRSVSPTPSSDPDGKPVDATHPCFGGWGYGKGGGQAYAPIFQHPRRPRSAARRRPEKRRSRLSGRPQVRHAHAEPLRDQRPAVGRQRRRLHLRR